MWGGEVYLVFLLPCIRNTLYQDDGKGGSHHNRNRHNLQNRQNRHGCLFVLHFVGPAKPSWRLPLNPLFHHPDYIACYGQSKRLLHQSVKDEKETGVGCISQSHPFGKLLYADLCNHGVLITPMEHWFVMGVVGLHGFSWEISNFSGIFKWPDIAPTTTTERAKHYILRVWRCAPSAPGKRNGAFYLSRSICGDKTACWVSLDVRQFRKAGGGNGRHHFWGRNFPRSSWKSFVLFFNLVGASKDSGHSQI